MIVIYHDFQVQAQLKKEKILELFLLENDNILFISFSILFNHFLILCYIGLFYCKYIICKNLYKIIIYSLIDVEESFLFHY
jgi:hypothetical protein